MFRTEYIPTPASFQISHSSNILTIGSCFAEVLGNQLTENKFSTLANPLGIHYHPVSIFNHFLSKPDLDDPLFVQKNGFWFHHLHHSSVYAETRDKLYLKIKEQSKFLQSFIGRCDTIVITFGTALQYIHLETGKPVANCHKMPASLFSKEITLVHEIVEYFGRFEKNLSEKNGQLNFILTVSPVRHIKDSLPMNFLSKSVLRLACHELAARHGNVHYFPSFEIMMDDLRDYRFYQEDMIHPNGVAEKYIWEKFRKTFFSEETRELTEKWSKLQKDLAHRPFHPQSEGYKKFLETTLDKLKGLSDSIPLEDEIKTISEKLTHFK